MKRIIFCDIDGCLSQGSGQSFDLDTLGQIRQRIEELAEQGTGFSLCTGRPQPYAEAMGQLLGLTCLSICENGAVIYDPLGDRYKPMISAEAKIHVDQVQLVLTEEGYFSDDLYLEIGNAYSICFKGEALESRGYQGIADEMAHLAARFWDMEVNWSHSHNAIDITPKGVNKGSGVRAVLEQYNLELADAMGIGDAFGDLSFLSIVGRVCCPDNASSEIKALANYISAERDVKAVLDILRRE